MSEIALTLIGHAPREKGRTYAHLNFRRESVSCYILSLFHPAGGSIDSDCAFEPDYAVPPFSMTEGMQHIRIMEGMSRSLPSSPLLTHQTISMRLQPVKKLTGKDAARSCDVEGVQFSRISRITRDHLKGSQQILWAGRVWICSVQTSAACLCPPPNTSWNSPLYYCRQRNGSTENFLAQSEGEWISEAFCQAGSALSSFLFVRHP